MKKLESNRGKNERLPPKHHLKHACLREKPSLTAQMCSTPRPKHVTDQGGLLVTELSLSAPCPEHRHLISRTSYSTSSATTRTSPGLTQYSWGNQQIQTCKPSCTPLKPPHNRVKQLPGLRKSPGSSRSCCQQECFTVT